MTWRIFTGDCIEQMRTLEEASVDAVVCDPPYGIGFMGHEWDQPGEFGPIKKNGRPAPFAGGRKDPSRGHGQSGANGSIEAGRYDLSLTANCRFQAWCEAWASEVLRVLKPGGHLLACGGSRTHHRLASGIEDAGFEIRDRIDTPDGRRIETPDGSLAWYFGSGFPKSADIHKALSKWARRTAALWFRAPYGSDRAGRAEAELLAVVAELEAPVEDAAWQGWGTALKPAHEPIVVARKPLIGTVAGNVLEHGTGALNIDGCRIPGAPRTTHADGNRTGSQDGKVALKPLTEGHESEGAAARWPANVILSHTEEYVPMGTKVVKPSNGSGRASAKSRGLTGGIFGDGSGEGHPGGQVDDDGTETVTDWECAPGCPVAQLDRQSGRLLSGRRAAGAYTSGGPNTYGDYAANERAELLGDSGGASRFFYSAKTSKAEREAGLDGFEAIEQANGNKWTDRDYRVEKGERPESSQSGPRRNHHPTVKPINLMRWLGRLVCPPGGLVLDPFTGSGSTGCAAVLEGFDFIGIEREPEYVAIAEARIAFWAQHVGRDVDEVLGLVGASTRETRRHTEAGQIGLEIHA